MFNYIDQSDYIFQDFNAFTYTIPRIPGVTINLRGDDVVIKLPKHRSYEVS